MLCIVLFFLYFYLFRVLVFSVFSMFFMALVSDFRGLPLEEGILLFNSSIFASFFLFVSVSDSMDLSFLLMYGLSFVIRFCIM